MFVSDEGEPVSIQQPWQVIRRKARLGSLRLHDLRQSHAAVSYLHHTILPALGALRVDAVTRADVARWFYEYGRERPGGANRARDIPRDMFARAITWGHGSERAGNPCAGITRYRRPPRGRLLNEDDLSRLGAALRRLAYDRPVEVAAGRLILLTGCRSGEVRRLRWRDVKRGRLLLHESKTGPRQVLLGEAARELLEHLSRLNSRFVGMVWPLPPRDTLSGMAGRRVR